MKFLVNSAPVFISEQTTLNDAAREMLRFNTGCILVTNSADYVTGIVTKSDILKGFLTTFRGQREQEAGSFMSKPVEFIRYNNLNYDLCRLFHDLSFSHYPVIRDQKANNCRSNIVGTLSINEIAQDILKKSSSPDKKALTNV